MAALWLSPEMDEEIMSFLIPKDADDQFWKITTNTQQTDMEGFNLLHISLANRKGNEINNLKTLQKKMPKKIWNELLETKSETLMKESPLMMASRLKKSEEILSILRQL
ncbi:hypothetical protein RFI_22375 [Reticulomyxa filosa]|uniref:Ankyrin repeat protein n=1 Tax=Reticulomyxa filosa TaxID=46433 RepID=X6MLV9_RETFI|nr:hypothetical protein RFI_22375 [Reticulomyxa filosa]|eukprot:ETO14993.1 hypothetical protein RFI_22375 [Reticulomyxa filosa]